MARRARKQTRWRRCLRAGGAGRTDRRRPRVGLLAPPAAELFVWSGRALPLAMHCSGLFY
jgi:hypothetical protein